MQSSAHRFLESVKKPPSRSSRGGFLVIEISLCHSQRLQSWLIDRGCLCQPMVALVSGDSSARLRSEQTVYFVVIITLLLQRRLDVCNHLVRRQVVIRRDRAIPSVISIRRVAPGRVPVTSVQEIRRAEHEHDVIAVVAMPPTLIVPLCMVVAENSILLALPVLASFNVSTLLQLHGRSLCGLWLFWNFNVLRLIRLVCF